MLQDKVTGVEREVDVLITRQVANYNVTIGIEVIDRKDPASAPWVEQMRARCENLEIDKLILVSRNGFTKPAIKKAHFYNIETLTLDEACDPDWPIAMLGSQSMFKEATLEYKWFLVCEFGDGEQEILKESSYSSDVISLVDKIIRNEMNRQSFCDTVYSKGSGEHEFSISLPGYQVNLNGRSGHVQIRVRLKISIHKTIVQNKFAKFQQMPFVESISSSSTNPLQVVILKTPEGDRGCIVDENGIRALWPLKDSSSTHPSSV